MEEEIIFDESKLSAKKKAIIFVIVFAIIIFAIIFFFKSFNFSVKKEIVLEVGDKLSLDVKDYITNNPLNDKDYKLDLDSVRVEDGKVVEVGEYTYRVTLKDTIKEGKIIVKDTKAPKVETIDLTIGTQDQIKADDFIAKCDDYSLPCVSTIDGNIDTSKTGTFDIKITTKDNKDNKTTNTVKLTVKDNYSFEEEKKSDIEAKYLEPDYGDWNHKYVISFSGAFDPEDSENYRWTYYEEFLNSNYNDYLEDKYSKYTVDKSNVEVIAVYNKYHYIIGFAARATLSDGKIVYLTNGE